MKASHSVTININTLDTAAALVCGKALANRATGLAIYAVIAGIRERIAQTAAEITTRELIGKDLRAEADLPNDRDPPSGMENRKTWQERLHEAAKLHEYGHNICEKLGTSEWDMPQSVSSRLDWNISTASNEVENPPKLTNSVAANAAAHALLTRSCEQLEFMREWKAEILTHVEASFSCINTEEAEDYMSSLTGLDRYNVLITSVTGLARQMVRMYDTISKLRPGSELARALSSELAAVEGSWKLMRGVTLESEKVDAAELLTAINAGRNFRDLSDSDKLVTALGINVEAAIA